MKIFQKYYKIILICVFSGIVFFQQINAYAWWPSWQPRYSRPYPRRVMSVPRPYKIVIVSGLKYYYHRGIFFRPGSSGFVSVRAPLGAVVSDLPPSCLTVCVNGSTYYTYDNVYYSKKSRGFMVVSQPVVTTPGRYEYKDYGHNGDTVVIHIPNTNGSYMPVVITRSRKGYIGPQGELYPEHPTVEQLQVLYAR
ncbi:MAG: hypothetical protein JW938_05820 [Candidatus Omnitrophica bacterium]|nr:hypothetical protein [Candidatus Omnitrophota bacterium]